MKLVSKISFPAILIICCFFLVNKSGAQKIDTISTFSITGYADAYYAYYTDSLGPNKFQQFPNTSPKSNTPSLNIAQLSFLYNAEKVRAAAVFGFGDFISCTWAPAPYNNIMEAHVGFKVYSKLWIDAGFFRTHFGTEFLLPVENFTSSIAVGTFYETAFESGVKLNFDPTPKLEINLFLLNGYTMFVDNNNKKSFGIGITYNVNDKVGLGYTNYIGDDTPADIAGDPHLRIANNVFINYTGKKLKLQLGADYFVQQNSDIATYKSNASMFSALATARYQAAKRCAIYCRGEFFTDPDGIVSPVITDHSGTKTGYKLWGATAGFEFKPTEGSYIRLENRYLKMDKDQYIYMHNGIGQNARYEIMVNGGVTFDLLKSFLTRKE